MNTKKLLVVLDAGKQDSEHFEFNRGVLIALTKAEIEFAFVAMDSMLSHHRSISGLIREYAVRTFWRNWPRIARDFIYKIISVWLVLKAHYIARNNILVLYSTPLGHLILAIMSRLFELKYIVYLHAEIEFISSRYDKPKYIGEYLILFALRFSGPKIHYITLTKSATDLISKFTKSHVSFVPHPISPEIMSKLDSFNIKDFSKKSIALSFFKGKLVDSKVESIFRQLSGIMSISVNGSLPILPKEGGNLLEIINLSESRTDLNRSDFECKFKESLIYILTAADNQYMLSASGLACTAASVGLIVIGTPNKFISEYATLYPDNFFIYDDNFIEKMPVLLKAVKPIDNLSESGNFFKKYLN